MRTPDIKETTKELGYLAKRSGTYVAAKEAILEMGGREALLSLNQGQVIAGTVGGASLGFGLTVPVLATLGLTAAISAGLTQMDFNHKKKALAETYGEELASKGKDLEGMAAENATLAKELGKIKKQRTFGVAMSFVASLASLAVVTFAPQVLASPQMFEALGHVGGMIAKGAMGLAAYYAVKTPLHWLGDKIFGLEEHTAHEQIVSLKRDREAGKTITREQVLEVFVSANPQLDRFIESEYGKEYGKLDAVQKHVATEAISKLVPLHQLADDINTGKVNVTELAFAVEGQISGVDHQLNPPETPKPGMLGALMGKMTGLFKRPPAHHDQGVSPEALSQHLAKHDGAAQHDHGAPQRSIVQQMGRGKREELSQVQLLEQRSKTSEQQPSLS